MEGKGEGCIGTAVTTREEKVGGADGEEMVRWWVERRGAIKVKRGWRGIKASLSNSFL